MTGARVVWPDPNDSPMAPSTFVARLIAEAWDHRRQRYRAVGLIVMVLMLAAALGVGILVGAHRRTASVSVVAQTFSSLTPDQDLGNHCPALNSVACDTLTFDVQLKRPAASVVATFGARVSRLEPIPRGDGFPAPGEVVDGSSGPWTGFFGALQPTPSMSVIRRQLTALPSIGDRRGSTSVRVRLVITYPDGQHVVTSAQAEPIRAYNNTRSGLLRRLLRPDSSMNSQGLRATCQCGRNSA